MLNSPGPNPGIFAQSFTRSTVPLTRSCHFLEGVRPWEFCLTKNRKKVEIPLHLLILYISSVKGTLVSTLSPGPTISHCPLDWTTPASSPYFPCKDEVAASKSQSRQQRRFLCFALRFGGGKRMVCFLSPPNPCCWDPTECP